MQKCGGAGQWGSGQQEVQAGCGGEKCFTTLQEGKSAESRAQLIDVQINCKYSFTCHYAVIIQHFFVTYDNYSNFHLFGNVYEIPEGTK